MNDVTTIDRTQREYSPAVKKALESRTAAAAPGA